MLLQFVYRTGPLTLVFGVIGLLGGFFYSTRPIRWVSLGFGEVWIALCYGWLPIAAACYIQTQAIAPIIHWIAIPVGLSIFNVILINEFPDHDADTQAMKKNIVVRIGRNNASFLYAIASVCSWLGVIMTWVHGANERIIFFYAPVFIISSVIMTMVLLKQWKQRSVLQKLCAATLVVNLGTTCAYMGVYIS